jgi:hypothetical protein
LRKKGILEYAKSTRPIASWISPSGFVEWGEGIGGVMAGGKGFAAMFPSDLEAASRGRCTGDENGLVSELQN